MSGCVCLKADQDGLSIEARPLRPFVFNPYLKLPADVYARWKPLLEYSGTIKVVGAGEYEAWEAQKAAAEAVLHYCGDSGGVSKKGAFCGKRVDGPSERCEHHGGNDVDMQGRYEERVGRPAEGLR